MIIISSLTLMLMVVAGFFLAIGLMFGSPIPDDQFAEVVGKSIGGGLVAMSQVFVLAGAMKMMKFENYVLAMTAAILSVLPVTICWLGLPFGIWAIVVLCLPNVRETFR